MDPRVELLSAVALLARPEARPRHPYEGRLAARLGPHRAHPAVEAFARLPPGDAAAAMEALLYLSAPPELRPVAPMPAGLSRLRPFLEKLRAFARDSAFAEFYAGEAATREYFLSRARAEAARDVGAAELGAYLGRAPARDCLFLLAPFFPAGGATMAMRVNSDGTDGVYARFPARPWEPGAEPYFGLDQTGSGVAHHWAHQATTPWMWARAKEIEALKDRPGPACVGGMEGDPLFCFEENLVQAVMLRLLRRRDPASYPKALAGQAAQFPRLPALCRSLEEYERSRARYPDLGAFYPRLLEAYR